MENILVVIQNVRNQVSKKERVLCDYILASPTEVMQLPVQSLAQRCQISAATVVRFCRRLDLDGYSDLKLHLSAAVQETQGQEYGEIKPGESASEISGKLQLHFENALKVTTKKLDDQVIETVVTALHEAHQVQLFGLVSSSLVVQDMYQKLSRLGLSAVVNNDIHLAATTLASGSTEDLLLVVSTSGNTKEVVTLLKFAKEKSITTVLVTANTNSTGAMLADHLLESQNLGESVIRPGASTSLVTEFFVADVLLFRYVARYYAEVLDSLKDSRELIKRLNND
ncbi:transcriptional regulator [Ligilactobacillus acidipiscis DSM 15836]|jgi:Transcriptional regulators|uniref:Transcriptional regulator n=1 Tax=Ligilactobacillus acidipiscis DSM 15836 TaxID=1423716 RepID=A0ABR5PN15_9LACO|nr:MurR/RpiR family transcriptional regulator [Ligilactobacillus acidipiscis]KRM31401.1 transcriptional regulator [Ligilactobacillus acidipiscis DSM 15836]GAW63133.1 RpiR family transcriptional regulator [Ligilactobacillus acidipiscis]GEN20138.1 transcriptional regulator [Ligilactobacillus acidipiscis]